MASSPLFTPEEDRILRAMRSGGASWRAIGHRLGRSHVGCNYRWRVLRIREGNRVRADANEARACT